MRMPIDIISVIGILVSVAAILGGQYLEGGHIGSLVQVTAFIIVLGGTFGACMLQYSLPVFLQGVKLLRWIVMPPRISLGALIIALTLLVDWGR